MKRKGNKVEKTNVKKKRVFTIELMNTLDRNIKVKRKKVMP